MPCFPVSFVNSIIDPGSLTTHGAAGQADGWTANLDLNTETCFICQRKERVAGQMLLKCSGRKVSTYYSKECQVKGWKDQGHKMNCKMLKQIDMNGM